MSKMNQSQFFNWTKSAGTSRYLTILLAMLGLNIVSSVNAQDARQVKEPVTPPVCRVLSAQLSSLAVTTSSTVNDTVRIQQAIDQCKSGQAVRFASAQAQSAFLSGPLQLRGGVSLIIDADVTLFASNNPKEFDRGTLTCGSNDQQGRGCKPFISIDQTKSSGIYGEGVIDGQGGSRILGQEESWWQIARRAQKENSRQNVPRLIEINQSQDITLHKITLRNSPNFHVTLNRVDGFTAWGIRIDTPATARNTDGIDPISSRNITIAHSYIHTGDDNIAIKAGNNGVTENISILHNHFYTGHGMSIGSETNGGVRHILVDDLTIDGATSGLRIKSDVSRGGLVEYVSYNNVCMNNVRAPIDLDTHYNRSATGSLIPEYRDISLSHIHSVTPGWIILQGLDALHPLKLKLHDVVIGGIGGRNEDQYTTQFEHVQFAGLDASSSINVKTMFSGASDYSCQDKFVTFPDAAVVKKRPQLDAVQARQFSLNEVLKYTGISGNERIDPWDPLSHPIVAVENVKADYIVDASAQEDRKKIFRQVQAAVNQAVTDYEKSPHPNRRIIILVKPGLYQELVYVPALATPITLLGLDAATTKISANLDAALPGATYISQFGAQFAQSHPMIVAMYDAIKTKPSLGTFGTAVLWVKNPEFEAKNITIENAYNKDKGNARAECQPGSCPDTGVYAQMLLVHHQALAVMLDGADKVHFDHVRLLGFQDTLYMRAPRAGETTRNFFQHSYIEGDVDFIFGDATAYFYQSEIKSLGDRSSSYVAAPSTNVKTRYGFVFDQCRFTHDGSPYALAGKFYLARQWFHNQKCTPYGSVPIPGYACEPGAVDQYTPPKGTISKTTLETVGKMVVMNSRIGVHIHATQPWSNWNKNGTLPFRPAQFSSDDYWNNLISANIDPVGQLGYSGKWMPDRVFLAEFNNTQE
ncbi:pectinesterase family protein [Undibacterium sp. Rencai35W]|uniref:pectinesterase family protein n=1 Tax=Undibacterium sp. Rencai35W TaxID=3413046 RepID=UPI003BF3741F